MKDQLRESELLGSAMAKWTASMELMKGDVVNNGERGVYYVIIVFIIKNGKHTTIVLSPCLPYLNYTQLL